MRLWRHARNLDAERACGIRRRLAEDLVTILEHASGLICITRCNCRNAGAGNRRSGFIEDVSRESQRGPRDFRVWSGAFLRPAMDFGLQRPIFLVAVDCDLAQFDAYARHDAQLLPEE